MSDLEESFLLTTDEDIPENAILHASNVPYRRQVHIEGEPRMPEYEAPSYHNSPSQEGYKPQPYTSQGMFSYMFIMSCTLLLLLFLSHFPILVEFIGERPVFIPSLIWLIMISICLGVALCNTAYCSYAYWTTVEPFTRSRIRVLYLRSNCVAAFQLMILFVFAYYNTTLNETDTNIPYHVNRICIAVFLHQITALYFILVWD
jgi:hypothetical protein